MKSRRTRFLNVNAQIPNENERTVVGHCYSQNICQYYCTTVLFFCLSWSIPVFSNFHPRFHSAVEGELLDPVGHLTLDRRGGVQT